MPPHNNQPGTRCDHCGRPVEHGRGAQYVVNGLVDGPVKRSRPGQGPGLLHNLSPDRASSFSDHACSGSGIGCSPWPSPGPV
jgi:hypothetical protein